MHRRSAMKIGAASTLAMMASHTFAASPRARQPIAVFAKHVQAMPVEELAKRLAEIGVDGIEATLRKGGQIEPKELPNKLGFLVQALAKFDQRILIAASNVNKADDASIQYLEQLANHDIPAFRMEYYRYDLSKPILPQLDAFHRTAEELAQVCRSVGVQALYQNHAGAKYAGAGVWDLHQLLADIDPKAMAVALDIRHTTLELSNSYPVAYDTIRPKIGATYIKDFEWLEGKATNVPLGQGRARPLFDLIQQQGFQGPLSLHMEYTDHRDESQLETSWKAIAQDVKTLQNWLTAKE